MIKTFRVAKYKNFVDTELNFGKINLFIGPNNSGKSNFIEAMQLGAELYGERGDERNSLHVALGKRCWESILNNGYTHDDAIELVNVLGDSTSDLFTSLLINISTNDNIPHGFYLEKASMSLRRASELGEITLNTRPNSVELITSFPGKEPIAYRYQLPNAVSLTKLAKELQKEDSFRKEAYLPFSTISEAMLKFFSGQHYYSFSDFTPSEISRAAQIKIDSTLLSPDCTNIIDVLRRLESNHDFLDTYVDILDMAIHNLEKIKLLHLSTDIYALQATIGKNKYSFSELSTGAIRMFVLALLLHTPERYTVLSLDEPELNLHPAWLKILGKWMMRGTSFDQLFISTHSPDLLDVFTEAFREGEASIYVFDLKEGPRQLAPSDVADFLDQGWELGDLYRVGEPQVGGWPW